MVRILRMPCEMVRPLKTREEDVSIRHLKHLWGGVAVGIKSIDDSTDAAIVHLKSGTSVFITVESMFELGFGVAGA